MKKIGVAVLLIFLTVAVSRDVCSSGVQLNIEHFTKLAKVVVVGECVSWGETKAEVLEKVDREIVEYNFKVDQVVKSDIGIETSKEFKFKTFAPSELKAGGRYLLFLKRYSYGIYAFVGGPSLGIFRISKDESGKTVVENRDGNTWLFLGVEGGLPETGLKTTSKGAQTDAEKRTKGPIELNEMVDIIKKMEGGRK